MKYQYIIATMLVFLLVLPLASAFEFDNVKRYYPAEEKIEIKNLFGLGADIADVKLVDYNPNCLPGSCYMYLDVTIHKDGLQSLKGSKYYLGKGGREIKDKQRTYEIWDEDYSYNIPNYVEQCTQTANKSRSCTSVQDGEKTIQGGWVDYNLATQLPIGSYKLREKIDIRAGETIDVVPEFYGIDLVEWVEFTGSDQVASHLTPGAEQGSYDSEQLSAQVFYNNQTADYQVRGVTIKFGGNVNGVQVYILGTNSSGLPDWSNIIASNLSADLLDNTYVNVTFPTVGIISTSTNYSIAIGGQLGGNGIRASAGSTYPEGQLYYSASNGLNSTWTPQGVAGTTDAEFMVYGVRQGVDTTLNSPADGVNFTTRSVTFNCSAVTSTSDMVNISLWLDGELNHTVFNTTRYSNLSLEYEIENIVGDFHNWTCDGWDQSNDQDWATTNWSFGIKNFVENSQTYNATALETSTEGFTINISYNEDIYAGATANLIYNGTTYAGTAVGSGNTRNFEATALTQTVNAASNASFYWEVNLVNATANTYENSTYNNQTITPINMSICGSPYTIPFFNFTTYDEGSGLIINGTIEVTFTYGQPGSTSTKSYSYSDLTEGNSSWNFCFNPPQYSYEVSTVLEYAASGYSQKNYNLNSVTVTNNTANYSLFLLNDTDSTSFIVHVRDSTYQDLVGVFVHVQRFNTGTGEWETTEISPTDFNGETVGHILTEDADYRFLIYQAGGTLLYTTETTKITCQVTPCTVTITVPAGVITADDLYGNITAFQYSLSESALLVSYSYSDTSSTFSQARLEVGQADAGTGQYFAPVCNTTNANAASLITCDLSPNIIANGTYVARAYVSRTGSGEEFVDLLRINKDSSAADMIGVDGVLWSIFFIITLVMLGLWRPTIAVLFAVAAVIVMRILNIMTIGISSVIAVVVIGAIIAFEMRKQ